MFKGIVFDVDGVLFNTEPLHVKAWRRIEEKYGFSFSDDFYTGWVGLPCAELAEVIRAKANLSVSGSELLREKEKVFSKLLHTEEYSIPGTSEGLKQLSRKVPVAWATTSIRAHVEIMFARAGITKYFSCGVCFEDVENKKPDPEAYLKAAAGLGVKPELCAGADDSPSGTKSASMAGLYTIGICSFFGKESLPSADIHFASTAEAMKWLLDST